MTQTGSAGADAPAPTPAKSSGRHRVVVVGSGFGGLFGTKALRRSDVDVTMVAKTTHHLFQPLLYQVATGILSEGEIAPPTREVLSRQGNAKVLLGEVTDIDLERRLVTSQVLGRETVSAYDSLIVAAGAGQSCGPPDGPGTGPLAPGDGVDGPGTGDRGRRRRPRRGRPRRCPFPTPRGVAARTVDLAPPGPR